MTTLTCSDTPVKPGRTRPKPERHLSFNALAGALFMQIGKTEFGYWLDPLPHQLGEGTLAFRLTKFLTTRKPGQPDSYDVRIQPGKSTGECECLGHLKHGATTVCKHQAALLALHATGKLS